jgi:hypothetical protein
MQVFAVAIYPHTMLLGMVPSSGYGEDITASNVFAIAGKRLIEAELRTALATSQQYKEPMMAHSQDRTAQSR